jgi:hypothetical protein
MVVILPCLQSRSPSEQFCIQQVTPPPGVEQTVRQIILRDEVSKLLSESLRAFTLLKRLVLESAQSGLPRSTNVSKVSTPPPCCQSMPSMLSLANNPTFLASLRRTVVHLTGVRRS